MQLQDYDISTRYPAKVLDTERLTPAESKEEVRNIAMVVESEDFRARVGQNIGVLAPGRPELGQEYHFRLYSVADLPQTTPEGGQQLSICVRRCTYVDPFSGEEFPGVASNYLCDLKPGAAITVTGPYGTAFDLPKRKHPTLIMIGAGTGIAPFRAFVKHIYRDRPDFAGNIWLFHGAATGLELLYRNQVKDDFVLYYDRETFEAIDALSPRPGWSSDIDWGSALHTRGKKLNKLLSDAKTYVYLAGLRKIGAELDNVLAEVIGSSERWYHRKAELEADHRWIELLY